MVTDPDTGKVDDGVEAGQRRRVEHAGAGIPGDLEVVPGRPADQDANGVPVTAQRRDERGADQTGGAGDSDVH